MESHNKLLYPLMVVAAIAVTVFSALGIATIMGYVPSVNSAEKTAASQLVAGVQPKTSPQHKNETVAAEEHAACVNCGVVESIRAVERRGSGTGLGAVAGGLTGLLVGNQMGRGNGRTAMTLLGGAGGAFAGNEIEKNSKRSMSYEVRVRLDNGGVRTIHEINSPSVAVGDKVRVVNGAIVSQS